MKNTEKLRNLLSLALQSTPEDFALQEIKAHIRHAIVKLEHVEKKRLRREQQQQQQVQTNSWPVVNGQITNPHELKQKISAIDELIASEKLKIEEIANRRKEKDASGDDVQTFFG
jgi:hypothetical protein